MKTKKPNSYRVGYVAECYVVLELAKRDLFATRMYKDYHYDYDFALSNGLKIEVKSSNICIARDKRRINTPSYERKIWQFNNPDRYYDDEMKQVSRGGRIRQCDYYILVCMDKGVPKRYYIIPTEVIQGRQGITIPVERKTNSEFSLEDFREKWELITKDYTTQLGGETNNG